LFLFLASLILSGNFKKIDGVNHVGYQLTPSSQKIILTIYHDEKGIKTTFYDVTNNLSMIVVS